MYCPAGAWWTSRRALDFSTGTVASLPGFASMSSSGDLFEHLSALFGQSLPELGSDVYFGINSQRFGERRTFSRAFLLHQLSSVLEAVRSRGPSFYLLIVTVTSRLQRPSSNHTSSSAASANRLESKGLSKFYKRYYNSLQTVEPEREVSDKSDSARFTNQSYYN